MMNREKALTRKWPVGYLVGSGMMFAIFQFCYFALLEWNLSSLWSTYAMVTLVWMLGSLGGLRFGKKSYFGGFLTTGLSGLAYFFSWAMAWIVPFDQRFLPLHAAAVGISGAQVGVFLRSAIGAGTDIGWVLFHENNGFILGLMVSFFAFFHFGHVYVVLAPISCAGLFIVISSILRRQGRIQ